MKEEAKEIIQNFSDTVKERIKNPVISTFVISWCIFNWNSLLLLAFSKDSIKQRIDIVSPMISEYTSWLLPLIFTVSYLFLNKRINFFFLKKLEKVDHDFIVIEYSKKKKELTLQKVNEELRADKDMAYEDRKTNKEQAIQEMREKITESKDREGVLTLEIDGLKKRLLELETSQAELEEDKIQLETQIDNLNYNEQDLQDKISKLQNDLSNSLEELKRANSFSEDITHAHSKLTEENKNLAKKNGALQQQITTLETLTGSLEEQIEYYKNKISLQTPRLGGIGLGSLTGTNELNKEINSENITSSKGWSKVISNGLAGLEEWDKEINKKRTNIFAHPNKVKKD